MKTENLKFMKQAIKEAKKSKQEKSKTSLYVGAVIIKNGRVLKKAYRGEKALGDHAEYTAIEKKRSDMDLSEATLYTTLEPCTTRNHPKVPCAHRIVEKGIKKVVIGILDPNPDISGKGYWFLKENGVIVELCPHRLQEEIRKLNHKFIAEQLEIAKQGGKVNPNGSLKSEVLEKRPEMRQKIKVIDSKNVTIAQAWRDVIINPTSPTPKKKPSSELLDRLANKYEEELKKGLE